MTYEAIIHGLDISITQYLAGFCLATLVLYAWAQMHGARWQQAVRACGSYLLIIGGLTVILTLRPDAARDPGYWEPITWFSFSMLLVLELLWIAFLVDHVWRAMRAFTHSHTPGQTAPDHAASHHAHWQETPLSRS
jgi:hypothetical protein